METIPESHKSLINILTVMRKYCNENKDDMMMFGNIGTGDNVFVTTLGAYRTGDAFMWFVDGVNYFLYSFVNDNDTKTRCLQFPIERTEEFAEAIKQVHDELKERGNPVTIQRP